jgi:diguanylate cyclase (GGDEF)-like protein
MTIEKYVDPVFYKDINLLSNLTMKELVGYLEKYKTDSIYITENNFPIYMFDSVDFLDVFLRNELDKNVLEYIEENKKNVSILNYDINLIDAYYYLRSNNLKKSAVVKDNVLIGEVTFKIISAKIADIVIKDPLTGLYNRKYFKVLIEEYKDFDKPLGLIYIDIKGIGIIEGLYGEEVVNNLLKGVGHLLNRLVRDIDFVFRDELRFKIITFTSLEVTKKIIQRIKKALDEFELDGMRVSYSMAFSHVPELQENVLLALDELEDKLID